MRKAAVALVGALLGVVTAGGATAVRLADRPAASVTPAAGCPAPVAVAHRGESDLAPQETGPAIVAAAKAGAPVIEWDIRWSKSRVAVTFHDATVDGTTNGTGLVSSLWWSELFALDAGSKFSPAYAGTHLVTLGQALRLVAPYPGVKVIPEIKDAGLPTTDLQTVAKAIVDSGMTGRVIVQSNSADTLTRFHAVAPTVPLALTTLTDPADPVAALQAVHAAYWLPDVDYLTSEHAAAARAAGIKVWPWTVDDQAGWERLAAMPVDGVLTDHAARYLGWAQARCG